MRNRTMRRLVIAGLLCCWCGCMRRDTVERASVEGMATLNGVSIEAGSISFLPTGSTKGPSAGGEIRGGRYAIAASRGPVVGHNRVEIRGGAKPTGRKLPDPYKAGAMVDEIIESIPDCYNARSTLEREIKPGRNILDFQLSKP